MFSSSLTHAPPPFNNNNFCKYIHNARCHSYRILVLFLLCMHLSNIMGCALLWFLLLLLFLIEGKKVSFGKFCCLFVKWVKWWGGKWVGEEVIWMKRERERERKQSFFSSLRNTRDLYVLKKNIWRVKIDKWREEKNVLLKYFFRRKKLKNLLFYTFPSWLTWACVFT